MSFHQLIESNSVVEVGRTDGTATLTGLCEWSLRYINSPQYGEPHPFESDMVCVRVKREGFGKYQDNWNWELCKITATYAPPDMLEDSENWERDWWDVSGQVLNLMPGRKWLSDGAPITDADISQGVVVPTMCYRVQRAFRWVNMRVALEMVGTVNNHLWRDVPADHLRFDGVSTSNDYDQWGNLIFRATFNFTYDSIGYSNVWRVLADGTGQYDSPDSPPLGYSDFSRLF
jgi:hypothetical protein